ncbi:MULTISPECIES: anti-sigma F factor [Caproicibacterium]|jgi:stage II sporulation protein AB (anti-sigma F factor)|uniref:Anti-sigma F factor n=1 Tax=Caproicibacterium lactatifermentans TaxID=2666138 RepID=A0A859DS64_9FIRM|nr:anti-sigma F factor [Caproicibacterium lactatifermentans]ARP49974.1 anti-sigma F factor [Ruminococcaceae bacterium CPB6]MDD4808110.1 anti-sigma F factor [Oscillospiraceae bacterium]QKN24305.1 anti-sigma F factor [Caproicibacterium lactatifermentans]QKO30681.1 anti-sigma F factor [Caproicibacterium lactatifermentans]
MKTLNEMHLHFPSVSINESFARAAVAAFAVQLDPTLDELCDLKTAVSEAVTNAIIHGYQDTIGVVYIDCRILPDSTIQVRVRDRGCGIADIQKAMEPLYTTSGSERAGLGFAVMKSFTDKLRVQSRLGVGTTVFMEKTFSPRVRCNG